MGIYVIAEAGVNHNGSMDLAKELIDVAAEAGADAVKFQTFEASAIASSAAPKADYQRKTTGGAESQLEMLRKLELSRDDHFELIEHCRARKIQFLSTAFDIDSLAFLMEELKMPRIKIASGEITNAPLLLKAASYGKPVILSTGMSDLRDVELALGVLAFGYHGDSDRPSIAAFKKTDRKILRDKVTLLHCTTEYPAPFAEVNLNVMQTLESEFSLPVGMSDHTTGITVPIAAAAMGATMIEKHFTTDRKLAGPDHKASLEPNELKAMVTAIRQVEEALGSSKKEQTASEAKNKPLARKSIVAGRAIRKGEQFTPQNLMVKRPGTGISPMHYWELLGKNSTKDYQPDELIQERVSE